MAAGGTELCDLHGKRDHHGHADSRPRNLEISQCDIIIVNGAQFMVSDGAGSGDHDIVGRLKGTQHLNSCTIRIVLYRVSSLILIKKSIGKRKMIEGIKRGMVGHLVKMLFYLGITRVPGSSREMGAFPHVSKKGKCRRPPSAWPFRPAPSSLAPSDCCPWLRLLAAAICRLLQSDKGGQGHRGTGGHRMQQGGQGDMGNWCNQEEGKGDGGDRGRNEEEGDRGDRGNWCNKEA